MLRGVLALRACWHAWYRGLAPNAGPAPSLDEAQMVSPRNACPFLAPYRDHCGIQVRAEGGHVCLLCGALARDNRRGFSTKGDGICKGHLASLTHAAASAILNNFDGDCMPRGTTCQSRKQEWALLYEACRSLNGGPIDPPPQRGGFTGLSLSDASDARGLPAVGSFRPAPRGISWGATHRPCGAFDCQVGISGLAHGSVPTSSASAALSQCSPTVHSHTGMLAAPSCPPCRGRSGPPLGGGSAWLRQLGDLAHVRAAQQGRRSRSPRRRVSISSATASRWQPHHHSTSAHMAGWNRLWDLDDMAVCHTPSVQ